MKVMEVVLMGAFVLVVSLMGLLVASRASDPFNHPSVKALEFAESISSFINTLSVSDSGLVEIDLKGEYDVGVVYYDGEFFVKKYFADKYRKFVGDPTYGKVGHYVMVSAIVANHTLEDTKFEKVNRTAYIFAYPEERDDDLIVSFDLVRKICIKKSIGREVAMVIEC